MKDKIILTTETKESLINELISRISDLLQTQPQNTPYPNKELLTRKEVCGLLAISLTTLHDWTHKRGLLKAQKIGNRILYSKSDILDRLRIIESRKSSLR